jgi:uncharacterized membrane protein YphA (DoxX/SURF4 family)
MNVFIWIVTGAVAAAFVLAGVMKLTQPKPALVSSGQGWAEDFPESTIKVIGLLEVLGVAGLILPGAFDVAAWLVPTAAIGLAITMVGAAFTHARRGEFQNVAVNLVLLVGLIFVAVERIGPNSF